jgi:hypothetical protein
VPGCKDPHPHLVDHRTNFAAVWAQVQEDLPRDAHLILCNRLIKDWTLLLFHIRKYAPGTFPFDMNISLMTEIIQHHLPLVPPELLQPPSQLVQFLLHGSISESLCRNRWAQTVSSFVTKSPPLDGTTRSSWNATLTSHIAHRSEAEIRKWTDWMDRVPNLPIEEKSPRSSHFFKSLSPRNRTRKPPKAGSVSPPTTTSLHKLIRSTSFTQDVPSTPSPPRAFPLSVDQLIHMNQEESHVLARAEDIPAKALIAPLVQAIMSKNWTNQISDFNTSWSINSQIKAVKEWQRQDEVHGPYKAQALAPSDCKDVHRGRPADAKLAQTHGDVLIDYALVLHFLAQWTLLERRIALGEMRQGFWEMYFDPTDRTYSIEKLSPDHPAPQLIMHWAHHQYLQSNTAWYSCLAPLFLDDWRTFTYFPEHMQHDTEFSHSPDHATCITTYHLYRCPLFVPSRLSTEPSVSVNCSLCRRIAPPSLPKKQVKAVKKRAKKEKERKKKLDKMVEVFNSRDPKISEEKKQKARHKIELIRKSAEVKSAQSKTKDKSQKTPRLLPKARPFQSSGNKRSSSEKGTRSSKSRDASPTELTRSIQSISAQRDLAKAEHSQIMTKDQIREHIMALSQFKKDTTELSMKVLLTASR